MEIAFLILTDYAESLNGKLYTLGAGWNVLRFPELPQDWRFTVGLGIDVAWDETNQRHGLEMLLQDRMAPSSAKPYRWRWKRGGRLGSRPARISGW